MKWPPEVFCLTSGGHFINYTCCFVLIVFGKFFKTLDFVVLDGIVLLLTWLVDVLINQDVLGDDDCQGNDD